MPIGDLCRLAHEQEQAGRIAEAERLLRQVLQAAPHHADALHLLGIVSYRQGRFAEALGLMQAAIAHGEDMPLYYRNICEMYRVLGRQAEAEAAARRAVALNPGGPDALVNLGVVLADRNRVDEAVTCFEAALALDPALAGAHFGLAEALLMRGDFARGWEEYEWRYRVGDAVPAMPPTDRPHWDGKALPNPADTLLLVADQGYGDAIQFGRYIPWAAARHPAVALACAPELQPLLRQLHPGLRLFTLWQDRGEFAAWAPLTGLPRLAGTTRDTVPAAVPYLRADPARRGHWARRLDALVPAELRRVGIVWAGRPAHKNDRKRSLALADLLPLAAVEGVALVVLQKGPAQREVAGYYGRAPLVHLSAEVADFADTAAVIDSLDLVVTVDTSVAHLAGAMGRPVWILLPWAAEWRWMTGRADTPWYPTARLFRQDAPGDWAGVVAKVADCLQTVREASLAPVRVPG